MEVIVPFSTDRPKSRLSSVLAPEERVAFARAMLDDVLDAVAGAGGEPRVLATDAVDLDRPVTVDDRPLTDAVNGALDTRLGADDESDSPPEPTAVVMADLALATPATLDRLFAAGRDADVAVAPGRGGGTNAFVASHPEFRVDYHGASYLDHREIAAAVGAAFETVDSHRLGTDVDEPADLAEVLIHGEGRAATWLREAGFALDASEGRVSVVRE
ncbi:MULTISPECIES: 2-phospho-L-lactate guanylyltransferase [Halorubrum]|uniref:2-phospho-L-lactate guanylyltransferase n=1 Tax=Halorubrum ezzemoulense TaxID=337243 RepID=A0A256K020_HALEZ|nr:MULTISPECIES: 2-phospho-L-lactate guanylyltransferase [Halorubrum]OYR74499.1 2-phospho-L-lactate guanylyltransferase [Halorubrum ezzemoulense]PHQ43852.1 2-phospho-L-lactate guanylyltransferase [Halorubrum sp. C191]QAY20240.1 2-phospho-L-lactate guanylyltransferase [Halorubrum ezzemoulense]